MFMVKIDWLSKDGLEPPIDSYKETVLPLNYSDY